MAESMYLSYEQVLQALQTNRGQLNQFIRSGRLRQHVVDGETKFRREEVDELKGELEKQPTVMEDAASSREGGTAMLGGMGGHEPETAVLEEGDEEARTTDILEEVSPVAEPDTVMLEEDLIEPGTGLLDEESSDTIELESDGDMAASESALETELDLKAMGADQAEEGEEEEEDFFDFSGDLEDVDFELESPAAAEVEPHDLTAESDELVLGEDTEDVVTEVLNLGGADDIAEEDLLSEIMEIDEDAEVAAPSSEDSADITAEITTMEEPTYEESDLDELLEAEEDVGAFEEDFVAEEEFEVPYAAAMEAPGEVSVLFVGMLILTLVILAFGGIFMVENSVNPQIDTPLTSWVPIER